MEIQQVIARLNELYHKSTQTPLSPDELQERDELRRIYLGAIRSQVKASLDQMEPGTGGCDCGHDQETH